MPQTLLIDLRQRSIEARLNSVRRKIADAEASGTDVEEWCIAAGAELTALNKEVGHGQWLPALKRAGISRRTAQQYMAYARNPALLERTRQRDAAYVKAHPR